MSLAKMDPCTGVVHCASRRDLNLPSDFVSSIPYLFPSNACERTALDLAILLCDLVNIFNDSSGIAFYDFPIVLFHVGC